MLLLLLAASTRAGCSAPVQLQVGAQTPEKRDRKCRYVRAPNKRLLRAARSQPDTPSGQSRLNSELAKMADQERNATTRRVMPSTCRQTCNSPIAAALELELARIPEHMANACFSLFAPYRRLTRLDSTRVKSSRVELAAKPIRESWPIWAHFGQSNPIQSNASRLN